MPRRMSFSKTLPQMRDYTKTVTRRFGWKSLKVGDVITAIEKGMGLAKGERQVVMHDIEVQDVRRERLDAIDAADLEREGFPGMTPADFFKLIGAKPDRILTRIEFRHTRPCEPCDGVGQPQCPAYGEPPGYIECEWCGGDGFVYVGPNGDEPA